MDVKQFEELFGKYRYHPLAVGDGFDGLPTLVRGKFYIINHRHDPHHSSAWWQSASTQLWRCNGEPNYHGASINDRWVVSYFMNTMDVNKAGCIDICGQYVWFARRQNVILELPEHQQEALALMWSTIGTQATCKHKWDLTDKGMKNAFSL